MVRPHQQQQQTERKPAPATTRTGWILFKYSDAAITKPVTYGGSSFKVSLTSTHH